MVAVAGAQLCYFSAVQYLSVGVALLLEYLAPVLLIGWHWVARPDGGRRRRCWSAPALSIVGLVFVLDLRGGFTLNPIGVALGSGRRALPVRRTSCSAEDSDGETTSTRCC